MAKQLLDEVQALAILAQRALVNLERLDEWLDLVLAELLPEVGQ